MLHEVLFALLGETGGIFVERQGAFLVRPDCDLLSSSESQLIERVLKVGYAYKTLNAFVGRHGAYTAGLRTVLKLKADEDEEVPGLYLKALCKGIDSLLDEYRWRVAAVEEEYLKKRVTTYADLEERVGGEILNSLLALTREITEKKLRGSQLLDLVSREERCPALKGPWSKMSVQLMNVFMHQLLAWTVHGSLLDNFFEFFIQQQDAEPGSEWTSRYCLNLEMLPETCLSASLAEKVLFLGKAVQVLGPALVRDQMDEFAGVLRKVQLNFSPLQLAQVLERQRKVMAHKLWNLVVVESMLTSNLAALKNYFLLGKGEFFHEFLAESKDLMALPAMQKNSEDEINAGPFAQAVSVLGLDDDPYLPRFRLKISEVGFTYKDFRSLESLVLLGSIARKEKAIRLAANRYAKKPGALWHNLRHRLDAGFVSVFTVQNPVASTIYFMIQSKKDISNNSAHPPTSPADLETCLIICVSMQQAAVQVTVTLNIDKVLEGQVEIPSKPERTVKIQSEGELLKVEVDDLIVVEGRVVLASVLDDAGKAYVGLSALSQLPVEVCSWGLAAGSKISQPVVFDSWSALTMDFKVEGPLELLFSPQVLDKYKTLFSFLFAMRRAQFSLQQAWLAQARKANINQAALALRAQMNLMIDSLISYLQLDVIEAQYSRLIASIELSQDFEEVKRHHDTFIATISSQCFMHMPKLVSSLHDIARSCHELVQSLDHGYAPAVLRQKFEQQSMFVFRVLSSIKSQQAGLGQLLLRIDFNRHYSQMLSQA
jgi:gamma-tubulin complex component 4